MRSTTTSLFVLLLGFGAIAPAAFARLLDNWPYERLFKAADLVFIARPTGSEDCADRSAANPWKEEFIGVNSTFKVESTLKGRPEGDTVKVLHFRTKVGVKIDNGPLHIAFRQKGITLHLKDAEVFLGPPEYLLFLRAVKDGRYEPVSGRVDPALSVREVSEPLNDYFGDK